MATVKNHALLWMLSLLLSSPFVKSQSISPAENEGVVVFEDNFQKSLKEGWYWLRKENDAYRFTDQGLSMKSLDGNIWGLQKSGRNFLVRDLPPLENGIGTHVTISTHPTQPFEQAGLIWFEDESRYVKLVVE